MHDYRYQLNPVFVSEMISVPDETFKSRMGDHCQFNHILTPIYLFCPLRYQELWLNTITILNIPNLQMMGTSPK